MVRFKRIIVLFLINNFLSFTKFFGIKNYLLNFAEVKVGKNTKVVGPIYLGNCIDVTIGDECWIGKNIQLDGNGKIVIGNKVDIAPNVIINTGGHEIGNLDRRAGKGILNEIIIENGTWIGTRATIINNIKIKEGAVIAAGSIVNKDVEKNNLVAGNPIKVKRILRGLSI